MRTANVIAGLPILRPCYDNQDGFDIGAGHDAICSYATDRALSPEDAQKMIELGWFQEVDAEDFLPEHYDPEESWVAFA